MLSRHPEVLARTYSAEICHEKVRPVRFPPHYSRYCNYLGVRVVAVNSRVKVGEPQSGNRRWTGQLRPIRGYGLLQSTTVARETALGQLGRVLSKPTYNRCLGEHRGPGPMRCRCSWHIYSLGMGRECCRFLRRQQRRGPGESLRRGRRMPGYGYSSTDMSIIRAGKDQPRVSSS
jgi:hypothetical protein